MTCGLALVTGASCGVGFALAEQFARCGYDLIIADPYDEIHTAAAALTVLGTDVQPVQVDLRSVDQARRLHRCVTGGDRPVLNAALIASLHDARQLDGSLDCVLDEVDANVRGTMLFAQLLAADMVSYGRGAIIVSAAPVGATAELSAAVHSASLALLHAFTETLQNDLSDSGVRVTALMPEPARSAGGSFTDLLLSLVGVAPDSVEIARQAFETLTNSPQQGFAARTTGAVTSLVSRLLSDRVKEPVRHIISPTGERV